jgi:ParB family transcriptional regulator, chromosome partitioning protein
VSRQLTLLPTAAPTVRLERLALELIDGFDDAAPGAKLRELIRDLGLLQPVVVVPARSGRYHVVEGRRRCKAIAQLAEADDARTLPAVDALIVEGRQTGRREVRGGLTLALHASRTASPASELQAIENILETGGAESESVTVKEIAAQTGMSVQTVRRRLRLRSLTPALRAAFDEGKITASLAEAAARLPDACQQELERQLEAGRRLSAADVRDAARGRTAEATGELPGGLFAESEVVWQATVRGHLTAALFAIPPDGGYHELQRATRAALDELERVDTQDE